MISNGEGPVVALRGDIDALPMAERSGKEYAATGVTQVDNTTGQETPVAHTCGHDVHISSLLGAVQAFNSHRELWNGTLMAVFQPAEETAAGARMMADQDNAPGNHSPAFAPDMQSTLDRGVEALVVAASAWLVK